MIVNVNYGDEMNPVSSQSDDHHDECLCVFVCGSHVIECECLLIGRAYS